MTMKHAATKTTSAQGSAVAPAHTGKRLGTERVWLVLARRAYDEPLRQIGTVEADDSDLAGVYARSIYDEFAWIEMVVIPRDTLITVIEA
ncbi:MAG TPA: hypothetical protein VKQ36_08150 [Ktedonobacterales bacterium]|nr:hypothetical protein [Ktedonobacterales bacterium]